MALAAFFDDYLPLMPTRRRRNRPLMLNLMDMLENELDQKVGQVVRRLPTTFLDFDDHYEDNGRKRKRRADAVCAYEPKQKIQILTEDDKFQVKLDASNYEPGEISVKVINDRLAVSAKHETKDDDVYEYHEMVRSFELPEGVDPETVVSRLTANGQLSIEAPLKPQKDAVQERVIPVQITKDSESKDKSEDKEPDSEK
ncbi:hypothetical protein TNIN_53331 [Trichonephila inaurata madagascariensis]|uniref:SHSP domain-containing protein n=1 Tax=Trichonephila inaurata madagascariensis TaxID=2747483 RepID=A0A8X7CPI0_9ARAC|nr:hypothetical protein TNIN_53331 [Trichonephila inaurata madagascariensis]